MAILANMLIESSRCCQQVHYAISRGEVPCQVHDFNGGPFNTFVTAHDYSRISVKSLTAGLCDVIAAIIQ
jgi:hypothetical protein